MHVNINACFPFLFHSLPLPSPSPHLGEAPTSLAGKEEAEGLPGTTQVHGISQPVAL